MCGRHCAKHYTHTHTHTHRVGRVCNLLSLSCRNKDLKQQTSVTAWLQLIVLFGKQRIVHFET